MVDAVTPADRERFSEELANAITHGVGVPLSIFGLVLLVAWAALHTGALAITACTVFGAVLVVMYSASTLYHAIPHESVRSVLRMLDHIAIFLLIAGTYTPFTLLVLPPAWGWSLFALIWGLAILGISLELGLLRHNRRLAVTLYVAMGWLALVAIVPLATHLALAGLALLLAGGVAYTTGVPFYLSRRLPFHHSLWHVFVLAGSVLHYLCVLLYVLPHAGS